MADHIIGIQPNIIEGKGEIRNLNAAYREFWCPRTIRSERSVIGQKLWERNNLLNNFILEFLTRGSSSLFMVPFSRLSPCFDVLTL